MMQNHENHENIKIVLLGQIQCILKNSYTGIYAASHFDSILQATAKRITETGKFVSVDDLLSLAASSYDHFDNIVEHLLAHCRLLYDKSIIEMDIAPRFHIMDGNVKDERIKDDIPRSEFGDRYTKQKHTWLQKLLNNE